MSVRPHASFPELLIIFDWS